MAKPEKISHLSLSPRAPVGVYRHSLRTRLCPKSWSKDTQTASSGTLVIRAPLDQSLNFRQELWSYHGENRHAPLTSVKKFPDIGQPFRISTNPLSKSLDTGSLAVHETTTDKIMPLIRLSGDDGRCIEDKDSVESNTGLDVVNRFPGKKKCVNLSADGMLSARYGDLNDLSFGKLRRFNSEERLLSETQRMNKWRTEKWSGKPENKSLISILGKLPRVNKGCVKSLETIQREKFGGNRRIVATVNVNNPVLKVREITNSVATDSKSSKIAAGVKGLQSHLCHPNYEGEISKKYQNGSADDMEAEQKCVKNGIDTEAIIDSDGYGKFARKKSTSPQNSVKGGNLRDGKSAENQMAHVSNTMLGTSKCYPEFPSDGLPVKSSVPLKSPKKLKSKK